MRVGEAAANRLTIDITSSRDFTSDQTNVLWAKLLCCYARDGMDAYERQLYRVYGGKPPGSQARWEAKAPERAAYERMISQKQGWALYRRVHGEPCEAEQARLEFERRTKEEGRTAAWRAGLTVRDRDGNVIPNPFEQAEVRSEVIVDLQGFGSEPCEDCEGDVAS